MTTDEDSKLLSDLWERTRVLFTVFDPESSRPTIVAARASGRILAMESFDRDSPTSQRVALALVIERMRTRQQKRRGKRMVKS